MIYVETKNQNHVVGFGALPGTIDKSEERQMVVEGIPN